MFDKGSWMETLGGWACTVVTGRARLGGIPVGVIAVETRSVEVMYPADPASPESEAKCVRLYVDLSIVVTRHMGL
jgi:acetyl-CoA carboxylase/biotin carboxylase 1